MQNPAGEVQGRRNLSGSEGGSKRLLRDKNERYITEAQPAPPVARSVIRVRRVMALLPKWTATAHTSRPVAT